MASETECQGIGGGGGGGGGGGTAGGRFTLGGGVVGTPGGGGGWGTWVSGRTQAARSKNRNSSAFSCGDRTVDLHDPGNATLLAEVSLPFWVETTALTWMSV